MPSHSSRNGHFKKIPLGIQDFKSLLKDGYLYIDKTALAYRLVSNGRYYFLSRPRRFGKSLFVSTLKAYFSGKKELFKDFALYTLEKERKQHPILHLDLNTVKYETPQALDEVLNEHLTAWENLYGKNPAEIGLGRRFQGVIRRAAEQSGERTVILVDEYDKPLLQAIGSPALQDEFRNTLKSFYSALKSMDAYIRFAFLTGVTKFGKVSVFSDLNHLTDISMDTRYYNLRGITEEELHQALSPYVSRFAQAQQMSLDDTFAMLRKRYNGYRFQKGLECVYNPYSLLSTFDKCEFGSYWFETGTPTYLIEWMKNADMNLENMSSAETDDKVLSGIDFNAPSPSPIPVIYQSGYLTFKGYDKELDLYKLGFPNEEVEEGFFRFLLPYYTSINEVDSSFQISQFVREIRAGKAEDLIKRLKSFFADTPYELIKDLENHYQNVIFIISKLAGLYVKAEYHTSQGRIDLVLQTKPYTYVMEFKLDGSAEDALQQIKDRTYTLPFDTQGTRVIRIGLNFSKTTRNIDKWVIEENVQINTSTFFLKAKHWIF